MCDRRRGVGRVGRRRHRTLRPSAAALGAHRSDAALARRGGVRRRRGHRGRLLRQGPEHRRSRQDDPRRRYRRLQCVRPVADAGRRARRRLRRHGAAPDRGGLVRLREGHHRGPLWRRRLRERVGMGRWGGRRHVPPRASRVEAVRHRDDFVASNGRRRVSDGGGHRGGRRRDPPLRWQVACARERRAAGAPRVGPRRRAHIRGGGWRDGPGCRGQRCPSRRESQHHVLSAGMQCGPDPRWHSEPTVSNRTSQRA